MPPTTTTTTVPPTTTTTTTTVPPTTTTVPPTTTTTVPTTTTTTVPPTTTTTTTTTTTSLAGAAMAEPSIADNYGSVLSVTSSDASSGITADLVVGPSASSGLLYGLTVSNSGHVVASGPHSVVYQPPRGVQVTVDEPPGWDCIFEDELLTCSTLRAIEVDERVTIGLLLTEESNPADVRRLLVALATTGLLLAAVVGLWFSIRRATA